MAHDDKPLTPSQARQKLQKGLIDYLAGNDPGPIVFRLKRSKKASSLTGFTCRPRSLASGRTIPPRTDA